MEAVVGKMRPFEDEDQDLKGGKPMSAIRMELHPSDFEGWAEQ